MDLFIYEGNPRPRYILEDGPVTFRLPVGAKGLAIVKNVETDYGAHSASYPMGTARSYTGKKRLVRETDYKPHLMLNVGINVGRVA